MPCPAKHNSRPDPRLEAARRAAYNFPRRSRAGRRSMSKPMSPGRKGIRRVGISTGGGDAPGLNAVIRAVVLAAHNRGWEVVGIRDGYNGIFLPDQYPDGGLIPLTPEAVRGITHLGGTIIGTTNAGQPAQVPGEAAGRHGGRGGPHRRAGEGPRRERHRRGGRDRRRRLADDRQRPARRRASASSACRRRSTTTSTARSSRSASTPRCPSPPSASTACTRRRPRTGA